MNGKKTLLILAAAFVLLMGGASVLYSQLSSQAPEQSLAATQPPEPQETEAAGTVDAPPEDAAEPEKIPAPDFTVVDGEGKEVSLSDFLGKPVVLNFWASWCGPCKMEMPDFEAAYQQLGDDIHFVMVNLTDGSRETVESAADFIQQQGYTFPIYYDTNYSAAIAYGASSIPLTFFIDAEGYPVAYGQGALSAETLQTGIDMIFPQQ